MPYDNQYYHGRDPGSIARFHHGVFSILARALPEDGRYLDLGAGTGLLASWLASQKKADVTAVEVSEFACATIRQRYPNVKTVVADLDRELPVDGPFDVVTMIHCLEHIRDPAGILRRIRAVLAPTGVFICVVPNCGPTLVRAMGHPKWGYNDPTHVRFFTRQTFHNLLRDVFPDTRVQTYPIPAVWLVSARLASALSMGLGAHLVAVARGGDRLSSG